MLPFTSHYRSSILILSSFLSLLCDTVSQYDIICPKVLVAYPSVHVTVPFISVLRSNHHNLQTKFPSIGKHVGIVVPGRV
jgi:hypothetical protein